MIRWAEARSSGYVVRTVERRAANARVESPLNGSDDRPASTATDQPTPRHPVGAVVALAVAAAICGFQLVVSWSLLHRQISTDESFTYFTVGGGLHELARGIRSDGGMMTYYGPLYAIQQVTGSTIEALRVVSFAAWCVLVGLACVWGARRQRLLAVAVALVTLGATRAMREAIVDARAAVPVALGAIVTMGLLHVAHTRRRRWINYAGAAALSGIVSFGHPSAVGVSGMLSLGTAVDAARPRPLVGHRWIAAAVLGPVLAVLVAVLSTPSIPEPGGNAAVKVGNEYFGSSWALTLFVLIAMALACAVPRGRDYALAVGALGGFVWCPAIIMLAYLNLPMPRYFVISTTTITVAAALLVPRGWRMTLLGFAAAASLVGSALFPHTASQNEPTWCSVAEAIDRTLAPGDTLTFADGGSRTPVFACLGPTGGLRLLDTARLIPPIERSEITDPRSLWATEVDDVKEAVLVGEGRHLLVWNPATKIFAMPAIDALLARGRTCTTDVFGAISLTTCSAAAP